MMEIQKVEVTKQNLDYLNSDLEKDLQRLDKAKQFLLRKILEKEETIQRSVFAVGQRRASHQNTPWDREKMGGRFTSLSLTLGVLFKH